MEDFADVGSHCSATLINCNICKIAIRAVKLAEDTDAGMQKLLASFCRVKRSFMDVSTGSCDL